MPKTEKLKVLESFLNMFDEMMSCLNIILENLLLINFNALDFQNIYNTTPESLANTLLKDIKVFGINIQRLLKVYILNSNTHHL
jgi:hypothetical protein